MQRGMELTVTVVMQRGMEWDSGRAKRESDHVKRHGTGQW